MLYVYQESKGLWWENRYIQLFGAVLNLGLNILLVNYIGLYGILISTIISMVFILDIGYCKILFKHYFNNKKWVKEFIFDQIKYFITTVVVCSITYFVSYNLDLSIKSFVIRIFVVIVIPNALLIILYRHTDNYKKMKNFIYNHYLKKNGE